MCRGMQGYIRDFVLSQGNISPLASLSIGRLIPFSVLNRKDDCTGKNVPSCVIIVRSEEDGVCTKRPYLLQQK